MAITAVGSVKGGTPGSGLTAVVASATYITGNFIIVLVVWEDVDPATIVVTDSGGVNVYNALTSPTANGVRERLFYAEDIVGFTGTITATFSTSTPFNNIVADEISGMMLSGSLDAQATTTGSIANITTPNVTTNTPDELLVVGIGLFGSTSATPGANWVERYDTGNTIKLYHRIVSQIGTYAVVVPTSPDQIVLASAQSWVSCIGTFRGAAGITLDQEGYRFRNDDGNEATATWKAAQDTNVTLAPGSVARLRFVVNGTGDPTSKALKLEFRKVGQTPWVGVPD